MDITTVSEAATSQSRLPIPSERLPQKLSVGARPHGLAPGELVKLHHSLAEAIGGEGGVVVQFIAPESGSGTEDVVYDLAYISAAWLGKRVLFVNGTGLRLDENDQFRSDRRDPQLGNGFDFADADQGITRVVGMDLFQMNLPTMRGSMEMMPTLSRIPEFLGKLRAAFDLVVIASPAAAEAPLGMLLSRFCRWQHPGAGIGRTRAPVAAELRNSLSASGGMVVGAVLTRYQTFAPRWLQRWL